MRTTTLGIMLALAAGGAATAQDARPNIIYIMSDDHASHAMSCYGSRINRTPQLDRLANEGMLFRNAFCTNSLCGPARAAILTGKYSHLNGFSRNGDRFDGGQQTVPKLLRRAGYTTAIVGKWHLGTDPTGFDYHCVLPGQGQYYNPAFIVMGERKRFEGYVTDLTTDFALDWLEKKRDKKKPFFLMLHHKAPHRRWQPGPRERNLFNDVTIPEPVTFGDTWAGRGTAARSTTMTIEHHLQKADVKGDPPAGLSAAERKSWLYQRYIKDYLRCVAGVDRNVGRVLDWLDTSGLAANTVVIYTSDQGFYLGDHGWFDKRFMYEESLRQPLLVRWPGKVAKQSSNDDLVVNIDFAETFLDIAGAEIPADMQGKSLVPILGGHTPRDWRKSIYYRYYEYPGPHSVRRHYGVRTQRYKLIYFHDLDEWELFDLVKDPHELHSVHDEAAYGDVRKRLHAELARLRKVYADNDTVWNPARKLAATFPRKLVLDWDSAEGRGRRRRFDPSFRPIELLVRCTPRCTRAVLAALGGESHGFSLWLDDGVPRFDLRRSGQLVTVKANRTIEQGKVVELRAALGRDQKLRIWIDGKPAAAAVRAGWIESRPSDRFSAGEDAGSLVGPYSDRLPFKGTIESIKLWWGATK